MPTVTVRDTSLYYDMVGSGEPALLFIHGMCGSTRNWEGQIQQLSSEFTCVAIDRRGHSRSAPGNGDQSIGTHAEDAAALIQALDLGQPVVVGSSSGGAITMELIHRYPERVRGAVVIEPPLLHLEPEAGKALVDELTPVIAAATESGEPRDAVDAFFEKVCTQFWSQADDTVKNRFRENAPMLFATLEAEGATFTAQDLAYIDKPVWVMSGSDSFRTGRTIARSLAASLPNSRFIEYEDCGHVTYAEKPEEFAQTVRAFARQVATPAATSNAAE